MQVAKQQVETLLQTLSDDCSLEDIQYHLYVIEKIRNGVLCADTDGAISHEAVERRLSKWVRE